METSSVKGGGDWRYTQSRAINGIKLFILECLEFFSKNRVDYLTNTKVREKTREAYD
jgi:hypothetical protein